MEYTVKEFALPGDGLVERDGAPGGLLWKNRGQIGEKFVAVADGHLAPNQKVVLSIRHDPDRDRIIAVPAPLPEPPPDDLP